MTTPTPLADQALARLRKLADGNGLAPEKIELVGAQENIFTLQGTARFMPFCERQSGQYPGPPQGKGRTIVAGRDALLSEAEKRQKAFLQGREWLPAAIADLKTAPGQGWGIENARITMPQFSAILAAPSPCPVCRGQRVTTCQHCSGQGLVTCPQCGGGGRETCPQCGGRGEMSTQPGQPCSMCQGMRTIPCRSCRSSGRITCPVCQGRRGVPCANCRGSGQITEEIALACGATVGFQMTGEELPSGLRRGLSRLGAANLSKGHADIYLVENEKKKELPPEAEGMIEDEKTENEAPPILRYEAKLPYADLRLRFGDDRAILVPAFGKRCVLLDLPPFLDDTLKPMREKLTEAARGKKRIEDALEARAMREALGLQLSGRRDAMELRRIYPVGLSPAAMQEIMKNMRLALNLATRHIRAAAAILSGGIGIALLGMLFLTPRHAELTQGWPWLAGLAFDLALPCLLATLGFLSLGKASQLVLHRRFPHLKISLRRHAGKTGYALFATITIGWIAMLAFASAKPLWLVYLLHMVKI